MTTRERAIRWVRRLRVIDGALAEVEESDPPMTRDQLAAEVQRAVAERDQEWATGAPEASRAVDEIVQRAVEEERAENVNTALAYARDCGCAHEIAAAIRVRQHTKER